MVIEGKGERDFFGGGRDFFLVCIWAIECECA